LFEPALSNVIEEIFEDSVRSVEDNLILFYIKDQDFALLLFKSFYPLGDIDKVKLPHSCYYLQNQDTINMLKTQLRDDEKLCLMHFSS